MAWENGTSQMKARRARRASPTVKPVEARLTFSSRYFYVNFFGPKGHFVMNKYLYYWTWILVIILLLYVWFEHPRHTYGGFVPSFSEQGMTPVKGYHVRGLPVESICRACADWSGKRMLRVGRVFPCRVYINSNRRDSRIWVTACLWQSSHS
jgi:hypothetical protein